MARKVTDRQVEEAQRTVQRRKLDKDIAVLKMDEAKATDPVKKAEIRAKRVAKEAERYAARRRRRRS